MLKIALNINCYLMTLVKWKFSSEKAVINKLFTFRGIFFLSSKLLDLKAEDIITDDLCWFQCKV